MPNGTDPVVININNGCAVNNISVSTTKVPTTISAAGYATFSSTYAVDFSKAEGLTAYTATVSDNKVVMTVFIPSDFTVFKGNFSVRIRKFDTG